MSRVRRLDHVGILVADSERALDYFRDHLGLEVTGSEEVETPHVRLTYLDVGNVSLQLVEPLDADSALAKQLDQAGEGLHHICLAVDDLAAGARAIGGSSDLPPPSRGPGRPTIFLPQDRCRHRVRIECTEFRYDEDVVPWRGWLA